MEKTTEVFGSNFKFTSGRSSEQAGGSKQFSPPSSNDKKEGSIAFSGLLQSPWRNVKWTTEQRTTLVNNISSYKPSCTEAARVLLVGPVGSGKSSFISSVQSVFKGRVINRAMIGSFSTSFTKKLQFFQINGLIGKQLQGLVLCDIMGLGGSAMTGLSLHDVLSAIKGHVPEGHTFSPVQPVNPSETLGYRKRPGLKEKIHCVAFVLDAVKMSTYHESLTSSFQQLREHISELGVHQVALVTHVDQVCPETAQDITNVYRSRLVQATINKAAALLGMSTSYIVPIKNYSSEVDVDVNTDVLLLSAVDHILQYANLFFDSIPQPEACEELF